MHFVVGKRSSPVARMPPGSRYAPEGKLRDMRDRQCLADTSSLTRLAENLSSNTKLLAGPLDEMGRAGSVTDLAAGFAALKAFESSFRLPEVNEVTRSSRPPGMAACQIHRPRTT
jgi:hypothetical protein